MNEKVTTFEDFSSVSKDFVGFCYVVSYKTHCWLTKNRILHNEHGPAVVCDDGTKAWLINGRRHRIDGPAVEWFDGRKEYCLFHSGYTEHEYWSHPLVLEYKLKHILETC